MQKIKSNPTDTTPALDRTHLHPGDRLCAAVSGGADSVALLLLLHDARQSLGAGLSAVHIHHGLRGAAADADLAFVQALCDRLELPLHTHHADTAAHAATHHQTIEEAARNLRYAFFRQLPIDAVLTAHTLDDQAETVLMKLLRGAWTEGLSGIHPILPLDPEASSTNSKLTAHNPKLYKKVLRPLLHIRRADLRTWLNSRDQPWREDASNLDVAHTRNRIRHTILPLLRQENPNLDQTLANLAELAREDEARWSAELARTLPHLLLPGKPVRGGGRAVSTAPGQTDAVAIELDRLRPLDPALRRRVIRAAARTLGARLTFDQTARLLALAGFGTSPNVAARTGATLHLANCLHAERSARELRLSLIAPGNVAPDDDPENSK